MTETKNEKTFGQIAFEAYSESVGGKTWDGKEIPPYEDLPDPIKTAWGDSR